MINPWLAAFQFNQAVVSFWAGQVQAVTGKPLDTSFDWQGMMKALEGADVGEAGMSDGLDNRRRVTRKHR
jgi:hypothetical protein